MKDGYELLDSGDGRKFERFGDIRLVRPCSQAMWRPQLSPAEWGKADASFDREEGNAWHGRARLPKEWTIETAGIRFRLSGTDFGHLGIFPEQRASWRWLRGVVKKGMSVLNLFAYSGGSTMASALSGASVCHVDAAKGMVEWARKNAALNGLDGHPIRWIVDDAHAFMRREIRRGHRYDGVILDPPTFGRGANGQLYKIERDLKETLSLVRDLLSEKPAFVLFSSHTPGLTLKVAENILSQAFPRATCAAEEMCLEGPRLPCPSGLSCRVTFATSQT